MADIKIKQITDQEEIFDIFHWFPGYSFGPTPPLPNKEEKIEQIKQRLGVKYFALYENGKAVSTVASLPMTQNVRGKLFPADGIFDVASNVGFDGIKVEICFTCFKISTVIAQSGHPNYSGLPHHFLP